MSTASAPSIEDQASNLLGTKSGGGLECHSAGILSSDRDRGSIFRTA